MGAVEPPLMGPPEPPTADEIERANQIVKQIWPALLLLARQGYGELRVHLADGRAGKWDAVWVERYHSQGGS